MVLAGFIGLAAIVSIPAEAAEEETIINNGTKDLAPGQRQGDHDLDEKPPEYLSLASNYYYGAIMEKIDINGDGYEDLVVGHYSSYQYVSIFDGRNDLSFPNLQTAENEARWTLTGVSGTYSYYFGRDFAVGDVNGDGYDDLLISHCYYTYTEYAHLFYGGPHWDTLSSLKDTDSNVTIRDSSSDYNYFGCRVALGDLDGDGYADIIVGAPYHSSSYGRVWYWYGSEDMEGTYDRNQANGYFMGEYYNYMSAGEINCGDFNGDGRDDLAIGNSYHRINGQYGVGSIYLIMPKSNFRDFFAGTLTMSSSYNEFDYIAFQGLGYYSSYGANVKFRDYNGDGYEDLIIGSGWGSTSTSYVHQTEYVYLIEGEDDPDTGRKYLSSSSDYDVRFRSGSDNRGLGATDWGDYDNDGKMDLLLGEYQNKECHVVLNEEFNGTSGDVFIDEVAALTIHAPSGSQYFAFPDYYSYSYSYCRGTTVVFWDRDFDGYDDIFVSDYYYSGGSSSTYGAVFGIAAFDMFGIGDFEAVGGDLPDGETFYSEYNSYEFSMSAWNKWDPALTSLEVTMEMKDYEVEFTYDGENGFQKVSDPRDVVEVTNTRIQIQGNDIKVSFNLSFSFDVDECDIDVDFIAKAAHIKYNERREDVGKIRNKMKYVGTYEVTWDSNGESRYQVGDVLRSGAWLPENAVLKFTGVKVVYNGTENFMEDLGVAPYYPRNDLFHMETKSSLGDVMIDDTSSGREFETMLSVGDRPLEVSFETYQVGLPSNKMITTLPEISVKVDIDTPTIPPGIQIHADDFYDENTRVDNDGELFVTWEVPGEYNSGIKEYQVRINGDDETIFNTKATFAKINTDAVGEVTVEIRAIDRVGHVGEWGMASIKIDNEALEFTNPIPADTEWFNVIDPEVGITISDKGGDAVIGSSIEYAVSFDDGETFGEWISAGAELNAPALQVRVMPMLMEGSNNLVKFRAMDLAGNEMESQPHRINIDISGVEFDELSVEGYDDWEYVWLDDGGVDLNIVVSDELSGISHSSIQYRLSTRGRKDLESKPWMSIDSAALTDEDDKTVSILLSLAGETELNMGDGNFIQFRARDVLDNALTYSDVFNLWVNTEPVPMISSPEDGMEYDENQMVIFDASGSTDYDGDDLTYTWTDTYESEDGTITQNVGEGTIEDLERFEMALGPGAHSIVLIISDGLHEITTESVNITVNKYIPPTWLYDIDSDGDGMPNWWEYNYRLAWDEDTNADGAYSSSFQDMDRQEIWDSVGSKYKDGQIQVTTDNDFDGDGHTDYEEYLQGTDPTQEDEFPIYALDGPDKDENLDLFLIGLIIMAIILLVVVMIFLAVNNVMIKKKIDDQKAKEAETEKELMDKALSSGGLDRLKALRSASEGKPVALPGSQLMADALPSAPVEGQPSDMGTAQPMGEPSPMPEGGAQPMGEAQPQPMAAPAGAAPQPIESQPLNNNDMQQ